MWRGQSGLNFNKYHQNVASFSWWVLYNVKIIYTGLYHKVFPNSFQPVFVWTYYSCTFQMCQEMTEAVRGKMIPTLCVAWKVRLGRISKSSDFRVCKKFSLFTIKLEMISFFLFSLYFWMRAEHWQVNDKTLFGWNAQIRRQTTVNIGPSPPGPIFFRLYIYIFMELLLAPCSLLELQETPNEILTHSDSIEMPYLTIYI